MVRTYRHVLSMGIQNTLAYRVNFFVRAVFNLVPMVAIIAMWRAIYADRPIEVGGYTLAQMISYYLLVTMVEATTSVTEDDWQIASEIRDGQISQFLTRPLDYLHYRLCLFLSGRLMYTLAAAAPVALFVFWNYQYLVAPPDWFTVGCFVFSVAMAGVLQFLLAYLVALLAFWVLEISTFVFILLAFERLASGQMFPLDILPSWLMQAALWTPFPYGMFFPVSIYMGRISGVELIQGLGMQLFWVGMIYALARLVWRRGLKTYTVVGG